MSFFDVTADPDSPYYVGPIGHDLLSGDDIRAEVTKQVDEDIAKGWLGDVVTPLARDKEIQDRYEERIAKAREGLDEQIDVRDPGTPPTTMWENASHQQMIDAVTQDADSASVAVTSEEWVALGNELTEHQRNLASAIDDSLSDWQGSGGDAARQHLASVGQWLSSTAKGAKLTGRQQEIHSQALNETQKQMAANPPVQFDAQAANAQLQTITDPVRFAQQAQQYQQTQQEQEAARQQAARIMKQYDETIGGAITTPAFPAPPKLAAPGSATTGGMAARNTASPMLARVEAQSATATTPQAPATPAAGQFAGSATGTGSVTAASMPDGGAVPGGASIPGGGLAAASGGFGGGSSGYSGGSSAGGTSGYSGAPLGTGSSSPGTSGVSGSGGGSYQGVPLPDDTIASSTTGFGTGRTPTIGYSGGINGDSIASRLGGSSGSYDPPSGINGGTFNAPPLGGTTGTGKGLGGIGSGKGIGGIGESGTAGKGLGGVGESGGGKGVGGAGLKGGGGAGGSAASAGRLAAGAASGAVAAEEAAAARAAGAAAGAGNRSGMAGGAPMAHGGKQGGGEDKEHRVADYLEGDPELFEGDQVIAPPVIGDWKNTKKPKKK
ncbi:PPE domain-containing protein [Amycolatopsis acididurans]|uniref:PPE domain-containing protein n=1 Tax=Amycolatopsis acididurans TaxID=2724524 RepID=UPI0028AA21BE|nr:PPE domain-containing protein [Amycolatopsis acididurans]